MSTVGVPGDALEWLARERSTVRDAALEEAAQAIEAEAGEWAGSGLARHYNSALRTAARIVRDLKGNPQ